MRKSSKDSRVWRGSNRSKRELGTWLWSECKSRRRRQSSCSKKENNWWQLESKCKRMPRSKSIKSTKPLRRWSSRVNLTLRSLRSLELTCLCPVPPLQRLTEVPRQLALTQDTILHNTYRGKKCLISQTETYDPLQLIIRSIKGQTTKMWFQLKNRIPLDQQKNRIELSEMLLSQSSSKRRPGPPSTTGQSSRMQKAQEKWINWPTVLESQLVWINNITRPMLRRASMKWERSSMTSSCSF